MKTMKRLGCLLLVLAMCLALGVTAMADGGYTITINNRAEGYAYAAYQIFSGTLYENDEPTGSVTMILSDIKWGSGVSETGQTALLEKYKVNSAAELADLLVSGLVSVHDFAVEVNEYLSNTVAGTADECINDVYTISNLEAGYYLVKNTKVPDTDGAYSSYILEVVGNVTVNPKESVPSSEKTVDESIYASVHDIGDVISFTLTHKDIQSDYDDYETYTLVFHDKMSEGLTFDSSSVAVTVITGSESYTMSADCYEVNVIESGLGDGCTFEVRISDLKTATDDGGNPIPTDAKSTVTVSYTATLNENAVVGDPVNTNIMHTEYSDNPYDSTETSKTPDHTVVVFTFGLEVNKVNGEREPLAGAGFTLYKYDDEEGDYVEYGNELSADAEGTTFTASGLGEGKYKIVETKTPAGYNSIDPIYFTVTAIIEDSGIETEHSAELTVTVTDSEGTPITETDPSFTITSGTASTTVVNESGSSLPGTGGIGTTIFYVIGAILVCGAAVVLVTRKRMNGKAGKTQG